MEEEQAESIDSGCIPDVLLENKWGEVGTILDDEYNFALGLLQHTVSTQSKKSTTDKKFTDGVPKKRKKSNSTPLELSICENESNSLPDDKQQRNKEKEQKKNKEITHEQNIQMDMSPQALEAEKSTLQKELKKLYNDKQQINKEKKYKQEKEQKKNKEITHKRNIQMDMSPEALRAEKSTLQKELKKLYRNKLGDLNVFQAKNRQRQIKARLKIIDKHIKKGQKKKRNEVKAAQEKVPVMPGYSGKPRKAIYNQNGKLVFSKFDFSNTEKMDEKRKPDLNHYLSKVLKEKEKVKALKAQGKVNDAVNLMDKKAWDHAMRKIRGEKVKDSSEKLVRSLNKKKFMKKKSQAQWNERTRIVEKKKEQKQEKRKQNIASRKQKNRNSKGKKWKAKGSNRVPGF